MGVKNGDKVLVEQVAQRQKVAFILSRAGVHHLILGIKIKQNIGGAQ